MCDQWQGMGVTAAELQLGAKVMVPVGAIPAEVNGGPSLVALATVLRRAAPDGDASVMVEPDDVWWLDVHMGPGLTLPQMYPAKQILGVPARGLVMAEPVEAGAVDGELSHLSFGEALRAVQVGAHIARDSWPGGSYVTAQAGYPDGIGVNANTARATGLARGSLAAFAPYLTRCVGSREADPAPLPTFVPWTPDQDDLFADDWRVQARPGR